MEIQPVQADTPFLHNIAPYPITKQLKPLPTFVEQKEEPPAHILPGMPAFPDPHTYKSTPVFEGHDTDMRRQKLAATRAKMQAEKALVKLHERMMPPPPTPSHAGPQPTPGRLAPSAPPSANPFLAEPRWEDSSSVPADQDSEQGSAAQHLLDADRGQAASVQHGRSSEATSEWAFVETSAAPAAPTRPLIPGFQLDWAAQMQDEAVVSASQLGFEDAYEDAEDDTAPEGPVVRGKGSKKRRGASKAGARRKPVKRSPQLEQAEAILAAGSRSLYMHDGTHGPPVVEMLDTPVVSAILPVVPHEPQLQEPQAEIF